MPDLISRSAMIAMMERQADYDTHPTSCYRMIRAVRNFPPAHAVPEDVFLELLKKVDPTEAVVWKQRAGLT